MEKSFETDSNFITNVFQTANGRNVKLSKKALEFTRNFFRENDVSESGYNQVQAITPVFETASGAAVQISDSALQYGSEFYNKFIELSENEEVVGCNLPTTTEVVSDSTQSLNHANTICNETLHNITDVNCISMKSFISDEFPLLVMKKPDGDDVVEVDENKVDYDSAMIMADIDWTKFCEEVTAEEVDRETKKEIEQVNKNSAATDVGDSFKLKRKGRFINSSTHTPMRRLQRIKHSNLLRHYVQTEASTATMLDFKPPRMSI